MEWPYIEYIPAGIKSQWEAKLTAISKRLNILPEWLMVVMWQESKLNPQAKNGSSAVGLIQFTNATVKITKKSLAEIYRMNHLQQLDLVEAYIKAAMDWKGPIRSLGDLYIVTFAPQYLRSSNATICFAKGTAGYNGNKALDFNRDGQISRADVVNFIQEKVPVTHKDAVAFNPNGGGVPSSFSGNGNTQQPGDSGVWAEPSDPAQGDPGK
ncbi:transglycosylase SLT domain-containing protein, partial [Siphonobacter sp.]|uniref:transglycosylase SLT domain-containing protein n=1 Tax=Siphonobacter sp. TaxID=1869184 RepID=UPI003B3B17A5